MKRTLIQNYQVEIEPNDGREGNNCFISKGDYSASLACLQETGVLTDCHDNESEVKQSVIDRITRWADANGYAD